MLLDSAPPVLVVTVALVLDVAFVAVAFGLRTWLQVRHFGEGGWRLGRPHSAAELVARLLLVLSGVVLVAAVAVAGDRRWLLVALGAAGSLGAIALTTTAQLHMGSSWRIGIDPAERTALVTGGLYRRIRNPIYTGMVAFAMSQAVLIGGVWAWAAALMMAVGVEVQVRAVEEPYLRRVHGPAYRRWAAVAGRFTPVLGRERPVAARTAAT